MIISVFTPHGGCPERCRFCDQKVSGGEPLAAARVTEAIEAHLKTGERASEIAFYGGTFTALPRERQRAYLDAAKPYLRDGRIQSVRVSTRPDAVSSPWLETLRNEYGLATVELGVQSFEAEALKRLGRSHSAEDVTRAVEILKSLGIKVGLHLMIGCPGESVEADAISVRWLARLKPDFVRIHPLLVLEGTELAREYREGAFRPLELEPALERAATLLEELALLDIPVIRLGLQPNELLDQRVVAGAYHPAFGDLAKGARDRRLAAQAIEAAARSLGVSSLARWTAELQTSARVAGRLKGHESRNIKWLQRRFELSSLRVNVVKDASRYDHIEVRLCHPAGPA